MRTRAHGFGQPLLAGGAIVVHEVDAGLLGDVTKMHLRASGANECGAHQQRRKKEEDSSHGGHGCGSLALVLVVRGSRNRPGWSERRRNMFVNRLPFVVVFGMQPAIRAGDGLRGLVRLEAQVPLLIFVGLFEIAQLPGSKASCCSSPAGLQDRRPGPRAIAPSRRCICAAGKECGPFRCALRGPWDIALPLSAGVAERRRNRHRCAVRARRKSSFAPGQGLETVRAAIPRGRAPCRPPARPRGPGSPTHQDSTGPPR